MSLSSSSASDHDQTLDSFEPFVSFGEVCVSDQIMDSSEPFVSPHDFGTVRDFDEGDSQELPDIESHADPKSATSSMEPRRESGFSRHTAESEQLIAGPSRQAPAEAYHPVAGPSRQAPAEAYQPAAGPSQQAPAEAYHPVAGPSRQAPAVAYQPAAGPSRQAPAEAYQPAAGPSQQAPAEAYQPAAGPSHNMDNVERIEELFNRIENVGAAVDNANHRVRRLTRPRVYIRNMYNQDPFDHYGDDEFKSRYRFTKHTVKNVILPLIEEDLHSSVGNRGLPLTAIIKVLVALRFYATGSFQTVCGDIISISQPTVCRVIAEVSLALAKLLPRYIHFPNADQIQHIKHQFEQMGRSPTRHGLNNIVAAMDCTHVKISRPRNIEHSEAYRNRKGIFSINTQVITGPNMEIFDIVARWPGSSHDSRIFRNSRAFRRFSLGEINGIIVGDSGYPSLPFILTPLLQTVSRAEINYNYAQIRTRNVIERFFGVWKRKFPCLQLGLRTKLRTTTNIIIACAVLHNIGIAYGDNYEVNENDNLNPPEQIQMRPMIPSSAQGLAMRQTVIAQFN